MVRFALIALVVASPVAAQQAAPAQPQPQPVAKADFIANWDKRFAAVDSNKDGFTDKAEMEAAQARIFETRRAQLLQRNEQAFKTLDVNNDGNLTLAEFNAKIREEKAPPFDASKEVADLDTNKDGKISVEESRAPALARFAQIDTNKDDTLSVAELEAASRGSSPATR